MNKDQQLVWDRLKHGMKPISLDEMLSKDLNALKEDYLRIQKEREQEIINEKHKQVHQGFIIARQKDAVTKSIKGSRGSGRACESGAAIRQRERDYTLIYRQKTNTRRGR